MGSRQPPRIAGRKKAMQFSARCDLKSKRSARQGYCSITIILSRRRDPAVITAHVDVLMRVTLAAVSKTNTASYAGLTRVSILFARVFRRGWIAGSSPAMTEAKAVQALAAELASATVALA
jgi:hypothetical protein